jgi:hypothetical protein
VGNAGDAHHLAVIIDDVHDTVIPDEDAPEILVTVQFPAAERSWIGGQPSILGASRPTRVPLRFSSFFRADGLMSRAYLNHFQGFCVPSK